MLASLTVKWTVATLKLQEHDEGEEQEEEKEEEENHDDGDEERERERDERFCLFFQEFSHKGNLTDR